MNGRMVHHPLRRSILSLVHQRHWNWSCSSCWTKLFSYSGCAFWLGFSRRHQVTAERPYRRQLSSWAHLDFHLHGSAAHDWADLICLRVGIPVASKTILVGCCYCLKHPRSTSELRSCHWLSSYHHWIAWWLPENNWKYCDSLISRGSTWSSQLTSLSLCSSSAILASHLACESRCHQHLHLLIGIHYIDDAQFLKLFRHEDHHLRDTSSRAEFHFQVLHSEYPKAVPCCFPAQFQMSWFSAWMAPQMYWSSALKEQQKKEVISNCSDELLLR